MQKHKVWFVLDFAKVISLKKTSYIGKYHRMLLSVYVSFVFVFVL